MDATTPYRAFEMQLNAIREVSHLTPETLAKCFAMNWTAWRENPPNHSEHVAEAFLYVMKRRLPTAIPYFVSDSIQELLFDAAIALPTDVLLDNSILPIGDLWIWLDGVFSDYSLYPDREPPCALLFGNWGGRLEPDEIDGAGFVAFSWNKAHQHLVPVGYDIWDSDWLIDQDGGDTPDRARTILRAFLVALQSFTSQRILQTAEHAPSRAERRRLLRVRDEISEPLVRVVQLRQKERRSSTGGERSTFEYHCQWIRRGHWHGYWCGPKDGERRLEPRWLLPQVVGPKDKPLKASRSTLYAVVR